MSRKRKHKSRFSLTSGFCSPWFKKPLLSPRLDWWPFEGKNLLSSLCLALPPGPQHVLHVLNSALSVSMYQALCWVWGDKKVKKMHMVHQAISHWWCHRGCEGQCEGLMQTLGRASHQTTLYIAQLWHEIPFLFSSFRWDTWKTMNSREGKAVFLPWSHPLIRSPREPMSWPVMWVSLTVYSW